MPQTLQEMADPAWAGRLMITRGGQQFHGHPCRGIAPDVGR